MVFQAQSRKRCQKKDDISPIWRCDKRNLPRPQVGRVYPHLLRASFYDPQHQATPMGKACNLSSALHQIKKKTSPNDDFLKTRKGCLALCLSASLPFVCACRPLYDYCSFPMHYTRPRSMYKGGLCCTTPLQDDRL